MLVAAAASLLPHGMKRLFDQTRPDRTTVVGHLHGVSFSGKREDAFPSGHALHMGALASAAGALPAGSRRVVRTLAVGLSLTRVMVLAHWASDVVAGFAVGSHRSAMRETRKGGESLRQNVMRGLVVECGDKSDAAGFMIETFVDQASTPVSMLTGNLGPGSGAAGRQGRISTFSRSHIQL